MHNSGADPVQGDTCLVTITSHLDYSADNVCFCHVCIGVWHCHCKVKQSWQLLSKQSSDWLSQKSLEAKKKRHNVIHIITIYHINVVGAMIPGATLSGAVCPW